MILDIALVVIALIAIATGYNKGALTTLLSILDTLAAVLQALRLLIGIAQSGKV